MAANRFASIPPLDLSPLIEGDRADTAALADQVDRCLQEYGFLVVLGHGVPDELRARTRAVAYEFFHQPEDAKAAVHVENRRGWIPAGHEATGYAAGGEAKVDMKESFTVGQNPFAGQRAVVRENRWNTGVAGFEATMIEYFAAMLELGDHLLKLFAIALDLDEDYLRRLAVEPDAEMNLNWYPAFDHIGAAEEGQFRVGAHSDYGCCTILDREAGAAGLQIRTLEGEWLDAPFVKGAYTINIGDLLARMTGDRWRSTPHRVLPPTPEAPAEELLSLVHFHELTRDALVETIAGPKAGPNRYEPVYADDYIDRKYGAVTVVN